MTPSEVTRHKKNGTHACRQKTYTCKMIIIIIIIYCYKIIILKLKRKNRKKQSQGVEEYRPTQTKTANTFSDWNCQTVVQTILKLYCNRFTGLTLNLPIKCDQLEAR